MYVIFDGFDLGIGILFPKFAETEHDRDQMMNSVAPFWDGDGTWLVLGGAGMMVAFPLASSIILPALYLPVIFMLLALVFRRSHLRVPLDRGDQQAPLDVRVHCRFDDRSFFTKGSILGAIDPGHQSGQRRVCRRCL